LVAVGEGADLRLLDALTNVAHELLSTAEADACVVSRALGDVLIVLTQATADGQSLDFGQGFLVSDYPATATVLRHGDASSLTLDDEQVDPAEAALLRELGYAALLMLPFELAGERWGLVELYRRAARHFSDAEITAAQSLLQRF
jgi:transcriptional regulator with GAF, ATPase, and Fis domain